VHTTRDLRCLRDQRPVRLEPATSAPRPRPPRITTIAAGLLIAIVVATCGAAFTAIATACSCEVDHGHVR
jgi:hypothetical protein